MDGADRREFTDEFAAAASRPTRHEHLDLDRRRAVLLTAAQAGDERAFRRLVEPYRRALEVHCYRMLGSPHDAEDVVQETLLRAWRGAGRASSAAPRSHTWLYRIATNACLDELERRAAPARAGRRAVSRRAAGRGRPRRCPTRPRATRCARAWSSRSCTAIQRLPGRQRAVLILRDVLGWTAPEVADLLETTVAAVNSALQRGAGDDRRATCPRAGAAAARGRPSASCCARYVDAWERDDIDGLVALLREDAVLRMPPQPAVHGAAAIVAFFRNTATAGDLRRHQPRADAGERPAGRGHAPALGGRDAAPHGILVLEVTGEGISGFDAWADPSLVPLFTRTDVYASVGAPWRGKIPPWEPTSTTSRRASCPTRRARSRACAPR